MYCHDLEVTSSHPSQVKLGVHSTSVQVTLEPPKINTFDFTMESWSALTAGACRQADKMLNPVSEGPGFDSHYWLYVWANFCFHANKPIWTLSVRKRWQKNCV